MMPFGLVGFVKLNVSQSNLSEMCQAVRIKAALLLPQTELEQREWD